MSLEGDLIDTIAVNRWWRELPRYSRNSVGLSISEYITRHRLRYAQAMLLNTDEKIFAIAMDCGFGSLSRFYEAFRARLGTTPRRYTARHGLGRYHSI
jgi:AraC-like DNA-binding protein